MSHFNDRSRIEEMKKPWTIWGTVIEVADFVHNAEVRRIEALHTSAFRNLINEQDGLFGALVTYRYLKGTLDGWQTCCGDRRNKSLS